MKNPEPGVNSAGTASKTAAPPSDPLADPNVQALANKSPTLKGDLENLKKQGWDIVYGPAGKGSSCVKAENPYIVIDSWTTFQRFSIWRRLPDDAFRQPTLPDGGRNPRHKRAITPRSPPASTG
ncbi:MAG: hypothetical protein LBT71_07885 [Azoarcus sp.]|jgi:hypothetical protein|nr:hypothetical protein [Azoarcus sp.]